MGYVIAAILVVLIVGGFVLFLVTNAAKKSNLAPDSATPAGDTPEHSETANAAHFRREESHPDAAPAVDGGEAEGRRSTR